MDCCLKFAPKIYVLLLFLSRTQSLLSTTMCLPSLMLQVGGKYVCTICGKQFLQRMRYMTHVDRHENVRRHVCATCGKAFTYKYSLWSHAKKCTGASIDPASEQASFSGCLKDLVGEAEFQRSPTILDEPTVWGRNADANIETDVGGVNPCVNASVDNRLESV